MLKRGFAVVVLCFLLSTAGLSAQTPNKVDFERDVLPILRQNCIGCHGPTKQMNGYRLDRRSVALRSLGPVFPGNAAASRLYLRLTTTEFGSPMPPTGALKAEDIAVIKTWIDQGASWPDALANEMDRPPVNAKAVAMIDSLRAGNRQSFMKLVAKDPKLLNARGPEGSTPFMYAVLYSNAATLRQLVQKGADVNHRNDANATALIWAGTDLEKTRVLLDAGADVNARSDNSRTALFVAAGRPEGASVVKLLLDRGADAKVSGVSPQDTPLVEAAAAGDAESMQLLIDHGADAKAAGGGALAAAVMTHCSRCIDLLAKKDLDRFAYSVALISIASVGDLNAVRYLLDRGADVNMADPVGRTVLMYATTSDVPLLEEVKLLTDRGANVNAKSNRNETALNFAQLRGDTPVVDLLLKAGATGRRSTPPQLRPVQGNTILAAVGRSLPLLQRTDASFTQKTGCISCHNESLPAMAVSSARTNTFTVNEPVAREQVKANVAILASRREQWYQGIPFVPFADADIFGYLLIGLHGEQYKPDINTDAVVMYIKSHQMPEGYWAGGRSARPPLCGGEITQTVLGMRSLQLYAPNIDKSGYEKSVQLAASWLAKAESKTTEDRAWRLLGLTWAGKDKDATQKAMRELLSTQRPDGGWSDISTLPSGAYATGQALVALGTAGLSTSEAAYQRGVQFLLNTQLEDGSWYVKTRAMGFQPYFDNGFPHGVDQWISEAATGWATMALALAAPIPARLASR